MEYYSFENLKLDSTGHYNLFEKTMVNRQDLPIYTIVTTDEFKGRLDNICKYLHGNTDYLEELMTMNNILNPNSVKSNTTIRYFKDTGNYELLYQSDPVENDKKDSILQMNKSKSTKKDSNRIGSVPTIKPDTLTQVDVNHNKKKITVINKFK